MTPRSRLQARDRGPVPASPQRSDRDLGPSSNRHTHVRTVPLAPPSHAAPRLAGSKGRNAASRRAPRARRSSTCPPRGMLGSAVRRARRGAGAGTRRCTCLPVPSPAAHRSARAGSPVSIVTAQLRGRNRHSWAVITLTRKPEIRIIPPKKKKPKSGGTTRAPGCRWWPR